MIDQAQFTVKAGNGGNGKVSFRREKYVPKGGPDGGDGGAGGSIYLISQPGLNTLRFFAGKTKFTAPSGGNGGSRQKHGSDGHDLVLKVPIGTMVYQNHRLLADLTQARQQICLARGGRGGRGNTHFKSSTNQTPRQAEPGQPGEKHHIKLELKLLAHIGLVGLPNAGKSTLLSVLTAAQPKIAPYPFTTLTPNLGIMDLPGQKDSLIIADIPGLIEGAHHGRGLGLKFLKHIERCRLLVYVLDGCQTSPPQDQLKQIKAELKAFNPKLLKLANLVVINKKDLLSNEQVKAIKSQFKSPIIISAITKENLNQLKSKLIELCSQV